MYMQSLFTQGLNDNRQEKRQFEMMCLINLVLKLQNVKIFTTDLPYSYVCMEFPKSCKIRQKWDTAMYV
jgi:hypothetical protein